MAYFDPDINFLVWLPEPLPEEVLANNQLQMMVREKGPESGMCDLDTSCGYIVRDWFGPFLFSPSSRAGRGFC
jgi:hypothetical protein